MDPVSVPSDLQGWFRANAASLAVLLTVVGGTWYLRGQMVTMDDLNDFARRSDLDDFARRSDLDDFARRSDLDDFARRSDLDDFARRSDLDDFARRSDLDGLASQSSVEAMSSRFDAFVREIDPIRLASSVGALDAGAVELRRDVDRLDGTIASLDEAADRIEANSDFMVACMVEIHRSWSRAVELLGRDRSSWGDYMDRPLLPVTCDTLRRRVIPVPADAPGNAQPRR